MTTDPPKLKILMNSNVRMTRGKYAAQAVHAALVALGVHPGIPVVVLGAPRVSLTEMRIQIRDAGQTEIQAGTLTAATDYVPEDDPEIVALVAEAREWNDPGLYTGFKENDQDERIRHWVKYKTPGDGAWGLMALTKTEREEFRADRDVWIGGHNHSPEVKCLPEYQCLAIEGYAHHLVARLLQVIDPR